MVVLGLASAASAKTPARRPVAHAHAAAARPHYLFDAEFSGPARSRPDPKKWIVNNSCRGFTNTKTCPSSGNVFQSGSGHLVLRIKRTATGASGALLATYNYGADWPNREQGEGELRAAVQGLDARGMPNTPGTWTALWLYNTDRTAAQHAYEVDVTEARMTFPTTAGCHAHDWVNGHDVRPWNRSMRVTNMASHWHTYSAVVTRDHVSSYVDGKLCGTSPAVSGRQGVIIDNVLGQRGSWGSGGGAPRAKTGARGTCWSTTYE